MLIAGFALSAFACPIDSLAARAFVEPAFPPACISEFYASGVADDEYLAIRSNSDDDIDMDGWSIADGEGAVVFKDHALLRGREEVVISFNSSSYSSAFGRLPDYSVDGAEQCGLAEVVGPFRLADDGDSIALLDACGMEVDYVLFGDATQTSENWSGPALPCPRRGEVLRRAANCADSDTASDWRHFREFKYGYSEHRTIACHVEPGCLSAFVSPDCSLDAVVGWMASATRSIRLCAYELDSLRVFETLVDAADRGVEVRVLLEGNPVGGISPREVAMLSALAVAGAEVTVVAGNLREGIVKHVSTLHPKYVVLDDDGLIVLSENFVEDGLPLDKVFGNRGWGIAMRSPELARYMALVFDDDSRPSRPDTFDWRDDERFNGSLAVAPEPDGLHTQGMLMPLVSSLGAGVTLFVSPDCSPTAPFLCGFVDQACEILAQQFQVDLLWETRWPDDEALDPLLQHVLERLRAGASCRMLFDSSWFNMDRNSEVARALTAVAVGESLEGSFMMMSERSPISVAHNKGLLLDGAVSVVSSNNWVFPSFARNRELAAVVHSTEVARYFTGAFELDWCPDVSAPVLDAPINMQVSCGDWVHISSSCFRDDRLIVGRSWDVGCDGTVEARTDELSILAAVPGPIEVGLKVTDAWGNEATTVIVIRVIAPSSPIALEPSPLPHPGAAIVPALIIIGYLALRTARARSAKNRR